MPHRIFLVEDNPLIRQTMVEMLEDVGGAKVVAWAESEAPAIAAMHATAWTIALVDLFLLHGSGIGIARAFAHRAAAQKLYVVSNYATKEIRSRCAELGANGVYDKSTELDQLLDELRQIPA